MAKPGEGDAQAGFPKHGDPAPDDAVVTDPQEIQDDPGDADPPEDPVRTLQRQVDSLKDELAATRRQIPPAEPKPRPEPPKDETDWDKLLFSNPKEAMALIKKQAKDEAIAEVTAQYNKDQGTQKFWNAFYAKNKDFKREQDHDLIELTLNKNLKDLANIPVDQALDKLADLTRDRILAYAGGKPKGKKAVAEGAEPPAPPRSPKAEVKAPASIGALIKQRRDQRRKGGRTATA